MAFNAVGHCCEPLMYIVLISLMEKIIHVIKENAWFFTSLWKALALDNQLPCMIYIYYFTYNGSKVEFIDFTHRRQ